MILFVVSVCEVMVLFLILFYGELILIVFLVGIGVGFVVGFFYYIGVFWYVKLG